MKLENMDFFFFECKKNFFLRMDFKYIVISLIVLSFGFKYIELREYDVILKKFILLFVDFCKKRIFNVFFLFKNIIF